MEAESEYFEVEVRDGERMLEDNQTAEINDEVLTPKRGRPKHVAGQRRRPSAREEGRKPWDQRYRSAWENDAKLAGWVAPVPGNTYRAWCRYCHCSVIARYQVLIAHQQRPKHVSRVAAGGAREPPAAASPGRPTAVSYGDSDRAQFSIGLGEISVGFVGGGPLAQAMAQGLLDQCVAQPGQLHVLGAAPEEAPAWRGWGCRLADTPSQLVEAAELLVVTVAPQSAAAALRSLAAAPPSGDRCLVSAVPGLPLAALRCLLSGWPADTLHLVRCAAGLPLAVGAGCCVYCTGAPLPERWLLAFETAFSALGRCCRLPDERQLDALSGLVDSGTAFTAAFVAALAAGAAGKGVAWPLARQLAAQTVAGAAQLLMSALLTPAELQERATPPGGHTTAGIRALDRAGFRATVAEAVEAAAERAGELGRSCEHEPAEMWGGDGGS